MTQYSIIASVVARYEGLTSQETCMAKCGEAVALCE